MSAIQRVNLRPDCLNPANCRLYVQNRKADIRLEENAKCIDTCVLLTSYTRETYERLGLSPRYAP